MSALSCGRIQMSVCVTILDVESVVPWGSGGQPRLEGEGGSGGDDGDDLPPSSSKHTGLY